MRIALAQIQSGTDPAANLELVEDYTRRAADAGASLVLFPEATMCRFGVPLAPIAEPLDGAVGRRGAAHRGRRGRHRRRRHVRSRRRRTRHQYADRVGPGVDAHYDKIYLYDAFGFTESRTVAPGREPVVITVDGVGRRAESLLRHPLPRALCRAGAARCGTHHRARLVGLWTGQARAVDAVGARPRTGHRRVSSPRSARPTPATRSPQRDRPEWAAASWHHRWAKS